MCPVGVTITNVRVKSLVNLLPTAHTVNSQWGGLKVTVNLLCLGVRQAKGHSELNLLCLDPRPLWFSLTLASPWAGRSRNRGWRETPDHVPSCLRSDGQRMTRQAIEQLMMLYNVWQCRVLDNIWHGAKKFDLKSYKMPKGYIGPLYIIALLLTAEMMSEVLRAMCCTPGVP